MTTGNSKYIAVLIAFLMVSLQFFAQERKTVVITDNSEVPLPSVEEQVGKEFLDSVKLTERWGEYFLQRNAALAEIYRDVCDIDSVKSSKNEIKKQLQIHKDAFKDAADYESYSQTYTPWKDNDDLYAQKKEYDNIVRKIENKIGDWDTFIAAQAPSGFNRLLILAIAAGVLLTTGLPIIMQIATKRSATKQQKETEWKSINTQYQQIPQDLNEAFLPIIQTLIMQCEDFVEKPPKRMHKKEALAKIKALKIKQLHIGKIIKIT